MRKRNDNREPEVGVPGVLLAADTAVTKSAPDRELSALVAKAVARVDRVEATQTREKAYTEERAIAKERAAASKRPRWLGGSILK
jgi:hypothetical protein